MNDNKLIGVNLGGWLVLEKWITPSLFFDTDATDEFSLCQELGDRKYELIKKHRDTFITEKDFSWIATNGFNAVRIPVGYWAFEGGEPFVDGSVDYLDWAMEQAAKNGLKVLIDLHAAPGSQNGWDHSGRSGSIGWHVDAVNIQRTINAIDVLASRYGSYSALWGVELLNEPHWEVPEKILMGYYKQAYQRVRHHCDDTVAVVMSDAFRAQEFSRRIAEENFINVAMDTHLYQLFSDEDKKLSVSGHLNKASFEWVNEIAALQTNIPVIVGEWSASLPIQVFKEADKVEGKYILQAYAATQLYAFSKTSGWFYWTLKTESRNDPWSLRSAREQGIFPAIKP